MLGIFDYTEHFVFSCPTIGVESLDYLLAFAGTELPFYATPGHTDASTCFTVSKYLLTGYTLIKDLRTVTKLPTGSVAKLRESMEILSSLRGKECVVYPGHGEVFELDGYNLETMINGGV